MKRRNFLQKSLLAPATLTLAHVPTNERATNAILTKDGQARNQQSIDCAGTPVDFKLLSQDSDGAMSLFVSSKNRKGNGPPLHVHHDLDEFFCVLEGEFVFQTGNEKKQLNPGDTLFIPRTVPHTFDCVSTKPGKLLVTIQPARNMEAFFRQTGLLLAGPNAPDMAAMQALYKAHDSVILGPPLGGK